MNKQISTSVRKFRFARLEFARSELWIGARYKVSVMGFAYSQVVNRGRVHATTHVDIYLALIPTVTLRLRYDVLTRYMVVRPPSRLPRRSP